MRFHLDIRMSSFDRFCGTYEIPSIEKNVKFLLGLRMIEYSIIKRKYGSINIHYNKYIPDNLLQDLRIDPETAD